MTPLWLPYYLDSNRSSFHLCESRVYRDNWTPYDIIFDRRSQRGCRDNLGFNISTL